MKGLGPWLQAFPPHTLGNPGPTVIAQTNLANIFTLAQEIANANGGTLLTLKSTNAGGGAGIGADLELYQDSTSPAAGDVPGRVIGYGKDSGNNKTAYGGLAVVIDDVTNTTEDAHTSLLAVIAGTLSEPLKAGDGIIIGGATGGFPGNGRINATGYRVNGVDLVDAFATKLLHLQHRQSAGVDGGTWTSGAFRTVPITNIITDEIGSSLASNQFPLPAGTYFIDAEAAAFAVDNYQHRLRNITDGADTLLGRTGRAGANQCTYGGVNGRFTIAGTKTFELQGRCTTTGTTTGFGNSAGFQTEIYADIKIWKIA